MLDVRELPYGVQILSQASCCYRAWPFRAHSAKCCHETFSFVVALPAMCLGDRFCVSRKGGTGGGGWVHPKGANSMAVSGLRGRKVLVGTGRAISVVFGINGLRK